MVTQKLPPSAAQHAPFTSSTCFILRGFFIRVHEKVPSSGVGHSKSVSAGRRGRKGQIGGSHRHSIGRMQASAFRQAMSNTPASVSIEDPQLADANSSWLIVRA